MTDESSTLRRIPGRTVSLVRGEGGAPRVVKRYRNPNPLARLFDRMRAEEERSLLSRLRERGLPVPAPIAVRRRGGAWELVMDWIPDTVTLAEAMRGLKAWPVPPARALEAAGSLLARAHAIGLEHPDLHPGNLLLQPDGRAWLVDLRRARLRPPLAAARMLADLAMTESAAREFLRPRLRARFLVAWLRALPVELARRLPARGELRAAVDARARELRRRIVHDARLRWTRASGSCAPFELHGARGFRSVAWNGTDPGAPGPRDGLLRVEGVPWRTLLEAWYAAARLSDHRVPAARPVAILRAGAPWAAFEVPPGACALARLEDCADPLARASRARSLGRLAGLLEDRGLRIEDGFAGRLLVGRRGEVLLAPLLGTALVAGPGARQDALALVGPAASPEREAFELGFASASLPAEARHGA